MKAEHRHELKTNALADSVSRLLQSLKTGPSRHSLLVWGGFLLVVVIIGTGYFIWKSNRDARSALWVQVDEAQRKLDNAATPADVEAALKGFQTTADQHAGTVQARALRADRARTLLRDGMEHLYSSERDDALKHVKEARDLYGQIAADKDNDPILIQEALMSVAKADESLGNLDEALKGYQKLAHDYPNSFLGKAADERAKYLEDENNRKKVKELYEALDKEVNKSQK
jgi:tetratricopeptide (TPR) repeat protein